MTNKTMYKGKKLLIVICARGGSKGIPGKNIKVVAGKPMIAHSIVAAQRFGKADKIVVSTDDDEIKAVAQQYGAEVPFVRPARLSDDKIGRIAAVIHALKESEKAYSDTFDVVMDFGNMAPLRTQEDIIGTIDMLLDTPNTDVVYTVSPAARNPYYNMVEIDKQGFAKLSKRLKSGFSARQAVPPVYDMNDSIYAISRDALMDHEDMKNPIQFESKLRQRGYVMPPERSVDIDRPIDLEFIRLLLDQNDQK